MEPDFGKYDHALVKVILGKKSELSVVSQRALYQQESAFHIFTKLFTMWNLKDGSFCGSPCCMANDSSEESSASESNWKSFNIQYSSSLNELCLESEEESPEIVELVGKFQQLSFNELDELQDPDPKELKENQVVEEKHNGNKAESVVPKPDVSLKDSNVKPAQPAEVVKDGNYFLQILRSEQQRLLDLAATADSFAAFLDTKTSRWEYALEKLRRFSGLARLLVSSKMGQFEDLCLLNLNPPAHSKYPVTVNDLHGFWDMIYQQVPQLDTDFAEILELKANNW